MPSPRSRPFRVLGIALAVLALAPAAAHTQAQGPVRSADSVRIGRLAALGRAWGAVKFLHPYLAYRDVDWDRALVEAIPRVSAARSPAEYRDAVNGMLSALGDPATHAEIADAVPAARGAAPPPDSVPVRVVDGVLRIDVTSLARLGAARGDAPREPLSRISAALPTARAVALDLRGAKLAPGEDEEAVGYLFTQTLQQVLGEVLDTTVTLGAVRARQHSGFTPQVGQSSGGYYSALATAEPASLAGRNPHRTPPLVAIVDAGTLPSLDVLGALRGPGRGVVQAGAAAPDGTPTHTISLTDGVRVRMRAGEIVNPDGTVGFTPDTVVTSSAEALWRDAVGRAVRSTTTAPALRAAAPVVRPGTDRAYPEMQFPGTGHRLLALFRFWSTIHYFYPYKHLVGRPWEEILAEYIPRFEADRDAADYQQTVFELVTELHDSHGSVRGASQLRERQGRAYPPFAARYVEGQTMISHLLEPVPGVQVGDVVLAVDGEPIQAYRDRAAAIVPASTPQALQRNIHSSFPRGLPGTTVRLSLRSPEGSVREVRVTRSVSGDDPRWQEASPTRRSTPVFGTLPGGFGYVDLERLQPGQVDSMFAALAAVPAIIFDMRGYPHGTAWSIAPRLTERTAVEAARFARPFVDARELDTFAGSDPPRLTFVQRLPPRTGAPYRGKVVMLIDENAQSQAEHTAMFFEAATDVTFIGTPTAGANGDVTNLVLPGSLVVGFSGHEVRHADGRPLQRVGIQPHVTVAPTIRGLMAGRDEVLEAAVSYLARTVAPGAR
jgi:C-terminal processing protease CtpA/Prc